MSEPNEGLSPPLPNPYAPSANPAANIVGAGLLSAEELKKVEAIIKDASQFWLAILICFLCSALGFVLIAPWYLVRLVQWNRFAQSHPMLLDPAAAPGSLGQRFQSSRWKLITGLVVGACFFVFITGLFVLASLVPEPAVTL